MKLSLAVQITLKFNSQRRVASRLPIELLAAEGLSKPNAYRNHLATS